MIRSARNLVLYALGKATPALVGLAAAVALAQPAGSQSIFSNGFESGTPCTWSTVQTPEHCFDGDDNDCDGAVDLVDPECADTLCEVCASDGDCLAPSDICLNLDDGLFCGRDCSPGNPYGTPVSECPTGYSCYDLGGGLPTQCVPNTNACLCDGTNLSLRLECTITAGETTCEGERTCTVSGWSSCIIPDEQGEFLCSDGVDNDCDESTDCDDVGCQGTAHCLGNGEACTNGDQCISGHCQNGFCCASGDCCFEAGDCPSPYTQSSSCTSTATCQGFRYDAACSSSVCGTVQTADDSGCDYSVLSDGCGFFADVFCDGTSAQSDPTCPTVCSLDTDCDATAHCDGSSVCVADFSNGYSCTGASACISGFCVDGVCCNVACNGLCMECDAANTGGSAGQCHMIPAGIDPDGECGTGYCNGVGGCTTPP